MPYKKNISSNNLSTATKLIIVESPSKCNKIEHFLGKNYCCIASIGHLRELNGLKSINIQNNFTPNYTIIKNKEPHIKQMKDVISRFSNSQIFLATDDDREGEAIAWHICEIFNLPLSTSRIKFHEITKNAIQQAIANPTTINMSLVTAQQTRQILDLIVGYTVSPLLWKYLYYNKNNSLSAGRCQTPALKLIYENNKEINKNVSSCYKIIGNFTNKQFNFTLQNTLNDEKEVLDFLNKTKTFKHNLIIGYKTKHTNNSPIPLCTSRLLQVASNKLNISPSVTMSLCQQLYQLGYITYMRTESKLYSKDFVDNITSIIKSKYGDKYIGDTNKLINTNSNNPHEAIRITQPNVYSIPNCNNSQMNSLYKLIWKHTFESCMANAIHENNTFNITAPNDNIYKMIIEMPIFYGWKIISSNNSITNEQSIITTLIQYLKSLQHNIEYNNIKSIFQYKSDHTYYTEASLVNKLEVLGIGRPSTYSNIIETIKERGYVVKKNSPNISIKCNEHTLMNNNIEIISNEKNFGNDKNKLIIQPLGILTIEFLTKYFFILFSYDYTQKMEEMIDKILYENKKDSVKMCQECYDDINNIIQNIKKISKKTFEICPNYELTFEKYSPVIKHICEDGSNEYIPAITDIQIDKLINKEYNLNELIRQDNILLGEYQNEELYLKKGKFGNYVQWGENTESIKNIQLDDDKNTLDSIIEYLNMKNENKIDNSILRTLTPNMSVRRGKYGIYVYYKTHEMKKPKFLNIKKFKDGYLNCDIEVLQKWLETQYNIPIQNM